MYWAQGLTVVYLDGALARALAPDVALPHRTVEAHPAFDGPARATHARGEASTGSE